MSVVTLVTQFDVPLIGVALCIAPSSSLPVVPFGVRVPPEHARAPVIRDQRRTYYRRTAAVAVGCTTVALLLGGFGLMWLGWPILLVEVLADLACVRAARRPIIAVKDAERWFAGRRQVVTTDTSWRFSPPRFPVRWLLPATALIVATMIIGAVRYPDLPARLATGLGSRGGAPKPKTPFTVFAAVAAQLYVTIEQTAVLLIIYRSRPDIDAADAVASTRRYRGYLMTITRAILTMVTLLDLTLLLVALRSWQVYQLSGIGSALPLLPFVAGMIILLVTVNRAGRRRSRWAGGRHPTPAATTTRDDDRFWKSGLIYVNRDDPAIMVASRFGAGWTVNFGSLAGRLLFAGILAAPLGLVAIRAAVGV